MEIAVGLMELTLLSMVQRCVCRMSGLHGTIFPDDVGFWLAFMGAVKQVSLPIKINRNLDTDITLMKLWYVS